MLMSSMIQLTNREHNDQLQAVYGLICCRALNMKVL